MVVILHGFNDTHVYKYKTDIHIIFTLACNSFFYIRICTNTLILMSLPKTDRVNLYLCVFVPDRLPNNNYYFILYVCVHGLNFNSLQ